MLQSNIVVSCLLLNLLFVMLDEYIFLYLYCRCSWELLLLLLLPRISTVEIVFTIWQFSCDSTLWSIIWRLLKNRLNDYELLLLDSIRFNVKDYRQYFFLSWWNAMDFSKHALAVSIDKIVTIYIWCINKNRKLRREKNIYLKRKGNDRTGKETKSLVRFPYEFE